MPSNPSLPIVSSIAERARQALAGEIRSMFNNPAAGEKPVVPSREGLFPPGSVVRRVHGDVTSMMVGGVAALLLQMLHPAVLAGVWDHSNFRTDMAGRLRRTARFIALTTYGSRDQADAAIARVRAVHARVRGTLPDGTAYEATDPKLLAWVHLTETTSFLAAWLRYGNPLMPASHQDRYFIEMAQIADAMGVDPTPRSRDQAMAQIAAVRRDLVCDDRTRKVARLVLNQPARSPAAEPVQALTVQAAIDLLPPWARRMHGFPEAALFRPLVRAGTFGIAQTVRWALK